MADQRFDALKNDPRYRLPSRKEARTTVDPRFKRLFTDQDFRKKATVDRYGRRIKSDQGKKELERLYRLDKEDSHSAKSKKREQIAETEIVGSSEESSEDSDAENETKPQRDIMREGFSESSSEEEDDSEEESESESEAEIELAEATAGHEQAEEVPMGEVSKRIAAVNLDWDNIRASDIMAVAQSFVPSGGKIESVIVYPSEFGRERLEKEELEGPPKEIFAVKSKDQLHESDNESSGDDSDEDEDAKIEKQLMQDQASDGAEFDTAKLRQYQLERLRYYYAVLTFSSPAAAKAVYDTLDGREYLTTANFFDLRFVPDETDFSDDKPHEECYKLSEGYRPNDFRTEALTHSKVRLTWDDDDTTRKEIQKRAFSRAEMDENDLKAYIGSDSSDAESVSSRKSTTTPEERKARKQEDKRRLMRERLGLATDGSRPKRGDDTGPVGEMQITFSSGLTGGQKAGQTGVFENEPQDAESTRERYIRKERERKQKRKERAKSARGGTEDNAEDEEVSADDGGAQDAVAADDLGFNDPFFTNPDAAATAEKTARKAEKQRKRDAKAAQEAEAASKRAELELLMADDQGDRTRHFDMKDVEKAEKAAKRKGKKGKKSAKPGQGDEHAEVEAFKVDAEDPRFKAVFESHEYAIDPTNPRYRGTDGMKTLLDEGRKRKKSTMVEDEPIESRAGKKSRASNPDALSTKGKDAELEGLVARFKKGKKQKENV